MVHLTLNAKALVLLAAAAGPIAYDTVAPPKTCAGYVIGSDEERRAREAEDQRRDADLAARADENLRRAEALDKRLAEVERLVDQELDEDEGTDEVPPPVKGRTRRK